MNGTCQNATQCGVAETHSVLLNDALQKRTAWTTWTERCRLPVVVLSFSLDSCTPRAYKSIDLSIASGYSAPL